jgi:hypothetical protein
LLFTQQFDSSAVLITRSGLSECDSPLPQLEGGWDRSWPEYVGIDGATIDYLVAIRGGVHVNGDSEG